MTTKLVTKKKSKEVSETLIFMRIHDYLILKHDFYQRLQPMIYKVLSQQIFFNFLYLINYYNLLLNLYTS